MVWLLCHSRKYLHLETHSSPLLLGYSLQEVAGALWAPWCSYGHRLMELSYGFWSLPLSHHRLIHLLLALHNTWSTILAALFSSNTIVVKCSEHIAWSSKWFIDVIKKGASIQWANASMWCTRRTPRMAACLSWCPHQWTPCHTGTSRILHTSTGT